MMSSVRLIILASVISLLVHVPANALDIVEPFPVGAVSEFEFYSAVNYQPEGVGGGMEFLVGGGITEQFSYYFACGASVVDRDIEINGPGFGFIWNPVNLEKFSFDIIPGMSFDSNSVDDHLSYPGFNAFTAQMILEMNCKAIHSFQPYMRFGFAGSYDYYSEDDFTYAFPITIGAMFPLKDKIEFFLQVGWIPEEDAVWKGAERDIGMGLNVMVLQNLEIITDTGFEFTEKKFRLLLGLIYTI